MTLNKQLFFVFHSFFVFYFLFVLFYWCRSSIVLFGLLDGKFLDCSKSGMDEAEFSKFHSTVKRGDIVGVTGFPGLDITIVNEFTRSFSYFVHLFNSFYVDSRSNFFSA